MRGSVLLMVASLGFAAILSTLLWMARRVTWRRPVSPLRQLESLSYTPERSGPSSGISKLDPMESEVTGLPQHPQGLDAQGLDPQSLNPQSLDPQGLDPQRLGAETIDNTDNINESSHVKVSQVEFPQVETLQDPRSTSGTSPDLSAATER